MDTPIAPGQPGYDFDPWDDEPATDEIAEVFELRRDLYQNGYRPVPVFGPDARVKKPGKQPVGEGWTNDARSDPPRAVVEEPASEALNTGILTDGLRPIDIDVDEPGIAKQVKDVALDIFGDEPLVRTRAHSPRRLLLYRADDGEPPKRAVIGKHGRVEVLGRGQQFVAFGVHAESGSRLNWNYGSPAYIPRDNLPAITEAQVTAFLDAVAPIIGARSAGTSDQAAPSQHPPDEGIEEAAFGDVAATLSVISDQNGDYDHWMRVGLATHAATNGSTKGLNLFDCWSQRCPAKYDAGAVQRAWQSMKPTRIGIGTLMKLAQDAQPGWRAPSWPNHPADEAVEDVEVNSALGGKTQQDHSAHRLSASPLRTLNLTKIEPRRWLYGRQLLRGMVSVLGGTGGVGKTSYVMAVGLSVASGRPLLAHGAEDDSHMVHRRGGVWYYNLEDPVDEVVRRIAAEVGHRNIAPRSIWDSFYVDSGRDKPLTVATRDRHGNVLRSPVIDALVEELKDKGIVLLVIDPFANSHEVAESDNDDMKIVVDQWRKVAHRADCAVWLIHHFRKGGQAGDAESFRGAIALQNGARVMETITTMSTDDAKVLRISPSERRDYVRLENAKVNLSRPPAEGEWYKFVGVPLGNGNDEYPQGDVIGVLDRRVPPSPLHGKSWQQVSDALDEIEAGPGNKEFYSGAPQASRWAGNVLIRGLGINEKQAAEQLQEWIAAGVLVANTYNSPSRNYGKAQRLEVDLEGKARLQAEMDAPA